MIPLDSWLFFNGFSEDFFYSALVPMLTPLFVTQHGSSAQSSGATRNHFGPQGFLSFNVSGPQPAVFHTVGGAQYMYERMIAESAKISSSFRTIKGSEVLAVSPAPGGWNVFAHPRSLRKGDVRPAPLPPKEYDEVVLGVNAAVAHSILASGGDGDIAQWPSCEPGALRVTCRRWHDSIFRAARNWALRNLEYEWSEVTLSKSAVDDPTCGDALYHIWDRGVMTGSIDRILDVAPKGSTGEYRLRVAPMPERGGTPDDVAPNRNQVLARRTWQHHRFNLWEHILVYRIIAHFNHYDGLHIAGDWTQSVGQDAAVRSGVRAACAVGLSEATKSQLVNLGMDPAVVAAC